MDMNETSVMSNVSVEQKILWDTNNYENRSYYPQVPSLDNYWTTSTEYHVSQCMQTYLPPVLIVFGTIGNVLSFWVLRKSSQQCSVFLYMALYALTNTLNLYVACGLYWISHITHTPYIANLADWLCKIWQFLFSVMRYTSTWLVVAMVFDRFVYLALPSWAHNFCTVFTAKILSCLTILILVVIGIHAMWTYELIGIRGCTIDDKRQDFQTIVWPWLAASMQTYLPTICVMVFDVVIIINLVLLSVRHYKDRNFSPVQSQLTKVVLVISISFLTLSLPTIILNFIIYLSPTPFIQDPHNYVQIRFASVVCQFLMFILCSINFPLYFLSLPMLRTEFVKLIKQASRRTSSDEAASNTYNESEMPGSDVNGKLLIKTADSSQTQDPQTIVTQL